MVISWRPRVATTWPVGVLAPLLHAASTLHAAAARAIPARRSIIKILSFRVRARPPISILSHCARRGQTAPWFPSGADAGQGFLVTPAEPFLWIDTRLA